MTLAGASSPRGTAGKGSLGERMRVLVLTPYAYGTAPGPRSSFELWERVLRDAGIYLEYLVFETDGLREIIHERGKAARKARELALAYARFAPRRSGALANTTPY